MSWVIVINSSFDSPETYYGKNVVHVQLMSVSLYVSCLALYYTADIPKLSAPPGGAVVCIRDIFILKKIWAQYIIYILVGTLLGWNIFLITIEVRSPAGTNNFSSSFCVQTSWDPPSLLSNVYQGSFAGGIAQLGHDADHSPLSSAKVKNE
jgi:hypothetical protein